MSAAMSTDQDRLSQFLAAHHPCIAINSFEEEYVLATLAERVLDLPRETLR